MKSIYYVVAALSLASLAACSSPNIRHANMPEASRQTLVLEETIRPMSRNEVIQAITDCHDNGFRAVTFYAKRLVSNQMSDVVIDVNCAPRARNNPS
jgi:hypothetical protein